MTENRRSIIFLKNRLSDWLLICASGAAAAAAFPKFNLFFLAWVALIPFLLLLSRWSSRQAFMRGTIAGFFFYAVLLYWIPAVPAYYGGLSPVFSVMIYLLFGLFLGLFWGLFAWSFALVRKKFSLKAYLLAPFLWVTTEYILTHLFTGFPWGLLGNSQAFNLYFIQLASVTGVYGLSLTIILFQCLICLSALKKNPRLLLLPLGLLLAVHTGGYLSINSRQADEVTFKGAVIQGNTPAATDFSAVDSGRFMSLFNRHLELSRRAYEEGADLIVWPELSVPLCFTCDFGIYPLLSRRLFDFVQKTGCTLLVGSNESSSAGGETEYYNAAVCVSPDLSLSSYYKTHLVPFGEYTPYKFIFGFLSTFTHAIGELTPGQELRLHKFKGHEFGSPICYEIIFPDLVRKFTQRGAGFLVTITNDGWYGTSSAPYQHFAIAVIRAVENRRYLLRAATTGISGVIAPTGRVLSRTGLNTQAFLTARIAINKDQSPYVRFGDWLSCLSLTITALFLILSLFFSNRNAGKKVKK